MRARRAQGRGPVLEIRGLCKTFGGFRAVSGVTLDGATGARSRAIIGPNGAGKTTFFNLHHRPPPARRGQRALQRRATSAACRPTRSAGCGMGRSFQRTNIFPTLTVLENVQAALPRRHAAQHWNLLDAGPRACYREETRALLELVGLLEQAAETAACWPTATRSSSSWRSRWPASPSCCCSTSRPRACRPQRDAARPSRSSSASRATRGLTLLFTEHDMDVVFAIARAHHGAAPGRRSSRRARPPRSAPTPEVQRVYLGSDATDGRCSSVEDVHTAYGLSPRAVRRVARGARRASASACSAATASARPPPCASIMGLTPPAGGRVTLEGPRHHRLAALPDRPRGHRLRAGGPAHLRRPHGVGEPRRRAAQTGRRRQDRLDAPSGCSISSPSCASSRDRPAASLAAASSRCSRSPAR